GTRSVAIARTRSFSGPKRCVWPTRSPTVRGRTRSASGTYRAPSLAAGASRNLSTRVRHGSGSDELRRRAATPAPSRFSRYTVRHVRGPFVLVAAGALGCCGGTGSQGDGARSPSNDANVTSIEIAELEISGKGVDRFTSCPPPGELGQDWIPKLPPWSPSA